jgi:hypothetical protein
LRGPAASAGPAHADHFVRHFGFDPNSGVDALRLSAKNPVESTSGDTPVVRGSVLMKAEKMATIVGYENPVLGRREGQNFVVRHEFAFRASNDVMTSCPIRRSSPRPAPECLLTVRIGALPPWRCPRAYLLH